MRCYNLNSDATKDEFDKGAGKGAIAFIHSPQCGHCVTTKPEWEKFEHKAMKMKDEFPKDVNILKIHADSLGTIGEEISQKVDGVPTIMMIKPGGMPGKIFSDQQRTHENFLNFFRDNLPNSGRGEKQNKGNRISNRRTIKKRKKQIDKQIKRVRTLRKEILKDIEDLNDKLDDYSEASGKKKRLYFTEDGGLELVE